jgi:hypothetical protein
MLNAASYTFEQGAVETRANKTYEQLKVANDTRVRTATTIAIDPSLSYSVSSLNKNQYFSVIKFNSIGVYYGSSDGWVTDEYTFTGASYIAIAVRNKDNSNIVPSDVYGIRVYLQNAVEALSNKTKQLQDQCEENTTKLNNMISISDIVPSFVVGAYMYNRSEETMTLTTNAARLTADLRGLELAQGDSVGITDYTTYSIAFGDNSTGGGWYSGGYNAHDIMANNVNIYPYVFLVKRNDNANISQTDIDAIKSQFHYTGGKKQINITEKFSEAINEVVTDDGSKICNNDYLHFSFDDVAYCILNLVNNGASFNSLWDEPFFSMLRRLHDTYGAIFSLYIWDVENLANIPSKFKAEFMASSEWLKFGFHSYTEGSLADTSYNDAKTQYETFVNYIFSKIGGVNSVDRIPRLNYFAGNVDALRALRDANCGCIGFLNTDDTRNAYYLTQEELTYLRTHSLWSDRTNGLQFISTVMRLDWFVSGFSSQYDYNVPVEDNPYDELVYRYGQPAMADLYGGLIVFTHEWQTYSSEHALNSAMVNRIEQVCQFANDYGYDFDYPQNRVPNISSYIIP